MITEYLHARLSVRIVGWLEPQLVDTYTQGNTNTHTHNTLHKILLT